jgi:3-deoxy-D-manno-octulosonic-acid transferase
MYFIYSLLLGLGFLLLLPKFVLDAFRHGKYISGLGERLGAIERLDNPARGPVLWLHCVSVGEVQAARPLLQAIRQHFPDYLIAISTVTVTGQQLAREIFMDDAQKIFYFPLDWRWTVRRALKAIDPSVVLIMETELWPGFLRESHRRQLPVAVVNGRLSEKSFRRYRLIPSFVSQVVNCLDLAVMQTEADAQRIRALGLQNERILVSGNMKFDAGTTNETNLLTEELAQRFHFRGTPVLLAASTHDPEEQIILEAFLRLRSTPATERLRLIIAPRHPERFAAVASLLAGSRLASARRSDRPAISDRDSDVVLLDSIGELRSLFPLASLVFVGGSIPPVGGHNILEPAAAGTCVVTGPHTENFDEIIKTFTAKQAIIQLGPMHNGEAAIALADVFAKLLSDPTQREELGARAKALIEENRGATIRTMKILTPILTNAARAPVPGNV